MKTLTPTHSPTVVLFTNRFRKDVHQLIAWGFEKAKSQITTDDEEDITGDIYKCIKNLLRSGQQSWFRHYTVKNEDPFSAEGRKGKDRKVTDILIEWVVGKHRPEYIFEAKPLNYSKTYQRTSNYTDEKGMCRFIKGEYAEYTARYPEVAMIGYVLSDTLECWQLRLFNAINEKREALQLVSSQKKVIVIEAFPLEWISEHKRGSSKIPVKIYHVLLDCTNLIQ